MPYIPKRKPIQTGNEEINALLAFLGGGDASDAAMDLVSPMGMARIIGKGAKSSVRKILEQIKNEKEMPVSAPKRMIPEDVQRAINESRDRTVFDSAKKFEDEIVMLNSEIDMLDAAGQSSIRKRFELQDAQKALADMKGELPPPKKLHPIEVEDLKRAEELKKRQPKNAIDLTGLFNKHIDGL